MGDFNVGGPYVMFQGTKWAHVMIPADHYYDYQDQGAPLSDPIERFTMFGHALVDADNRPTAMLLAPVLLFSLLTLSVGGFVGKRLASRSSYAQVKAEENDEEVAMVEEAEALMMPRPPSRC